jgi:4-carboxymuconolactone decarboxylase
MTAYTERLRRLSINDRRFLNEVLGGPTVDGAAAVDLDARTCAIARVVALVALDGPQSSFDCAVSAALAAGATPEDVVDALVAVGPTVGSSHIVSAAPKLAISLGYDIAMDLEHLEPFRPSAERATTIGH